MTATDCVVTYACPVAGTEHDVPGPNVRILKVGDGGFIVACNCGPESLADADSKPHPTTDHLVNIFAADPSPKQWLQLERGADGWHDTTASESPDGYEGTNGQRRARFRKRVKTLVEDRDCQFSSTAEDRDARQVECPDCGANPGRKCQRPSGHRVHSVHADRVEAAVEEGIIEQSPTNPSDDLPSNQHQSTILRWSTQQEG